MESGAEENGEGAGGGGCTLVTVGTGTGATLGVGTGTGATLGAVGLTAPSSALLPPPKRKATWERWDKKAELGGVGEGVGRWAGMGRALEVLSVLSLSLEASTSRCHCNGKQRRKVESAQLSSLILELSSSRSPYKKEERGRQDG